jgi:hypothetical protein
MSLLFETSIVNSNFYQTINIQPGLFFLVAFNNWKPKQGGIKMKRLLISLAIFALLVVPQFAFAQTKLVAVLDCDNADPQYTISVPDREGFSYQIYQNKCTWTKGSTLEGTESKDVVNVGFSDTRGATVGLTHTQVTHYTNGDKVFAAGTGNYNPKTLASSGKWFYTGGTGKFRELKGGGTYTCKSKSEDVGAGYTCDVEGEYTLPTAKK